MPPMTLPGTNIPIPPGEEKKGFALLEPVFAVSGGGLTLSQLSEMTGHSKLGQTRMGGQSGKQEIRGDAGRENLDDQSSSADYAD